MIRPQIHHWLRLLCSFDVFGQGLVCCYGRLLKQTGGLSEPPEGQHRTAAGRRVRTQTKKMEKVVSALNVVFRVTTKDISLVSSTSVMLLVSCDLSANRT